jgi:ABC-type multidrug transport system ATPase subunit
VADAVLQLSGVEKIIQKQTIVRKVDMQVRNGEVLALCGGNGAGKSTILRMIVGIQRPSGGEIRINGIRWQENRKKYTEQLGYMPDDYLFGQGLSAEETLTFWASLRKVSKERVMETLGLVGLSAVRSKSVTAFSKGMRQRLLFAQALLGNPPLLVMDEPTNGLDPYWMDSFVNLVNAAKMDGRAVIFSTHQLQVAEAVADHVVFLREGTVVREGAREAFGKHGLQAAFSELYGDRRAESEEKVR